jgi:hypothetical protein
LQAIVIEDTALLLKALNRLSMPISALLFKRTVGFLKRLCCGML